MNRKTVLARYQSGDRAFGAIDLYHARLDGIAVPDADFEQANLCGVNLARANLRGVNFKDANLSQANLQLADLRGADLSGANLRRSDLSGANLEDAILLGAQLTGAKLPSGRLFAGSSTLIEQYDLVPLSAIEIEQDLQTVARPKPKIPVIEPIVRSRNEFLRELPRFPLSCLGLGFLLFSLQMILLGVNPIGYGLLFVGQWGCVYRSDLAWFMPVLGGMIVFGSGGSSIVVVVGAVMFMALMLPTLLTRLELEGVSKGALWLSGLGMVMMLIYGVTIVKVDRYQPGVIVAAMLLMGMGAIAPEDMRIKRYGRWEMMRVTIVVAGVGMILGVAIGYLATVMGY